MDTHNARSHILSEVETEIEEVVEELNDLF